MLLSSTGILMIWGALTLGVLNLLFIAHAIGRIGKLENELKRLQAFVDGKSARRS